MSDFSVPQAIQQRLEEIERDLAIRQNAYEAAAKDWFTAQREIGRAKARALLGSNAPSVTEKKAHGDLAAYDVEGSANQAEYEALRAVVKVLETRATIGMALLKSHGRV